MTQCHTGPSPSTQAQARPFGQPMPVALPRVRTVCAHCAWARREHRGGDLAAGFTTAKTQRFLRVSGLEPLAYTPLHLDLHEVARKGVLTGEAVGAAPIDDIIGGNSSQVGEGAPSPTS
jgi:hypothetical protein